jgi:CheY-like chemotaxis protein
MSALVPRQKRLLIVETDPDIRDILNIFLTEEGFTVHFATSLQEGQALVDEWAFQLILADLFMGRPPGLSEEAQFLRRRAWPTPIGLMTTQNISAKQAKQQGFAFLLKKPFDLEQLLLSITTVLPQPLSPEQASQAKIVERFLEAARARDPDAVVALCTDEVIYHPPVSAPPAAARRIIGKAALRAYLEGMYRQVVGSQFDEVTFYGRPRGLVAQYQGRWKLRDGTDHRLSGVLHVRFEGKRIRQLGLRINPEHLRKRLGEGGGNRGEVGELLHSS